MLCPAALLATLLLAASPADNPLGSLRNQPILGVEVDAPPGANAAELRALIDIAPGYLLDSSDLEVAIKRLYALGRFSQVEVFAETVGAVVRLRFVLRPLRRLGAIEVEGLQVGSVSDLLGALSMPPGDEVDARTETHLAQRATAYLQRRGCLQPQADVERRDDLALGLSHFRLLVREGPYRRVASLVFTGQPRVAPAVLHDAMRTRPGAVLDLDALEEDRKALLALYNAHGFLQARVDAAQVSGTSEANVRFNIVAGDRIAIELTGSTAFSEASLRALWPETAASLGANVRLFQSRIQAVYLRAGFPQAHVGVRAFLDTGAGIRRYWVKIVEGPALFIDALRFEGLTAFDETLFNQQVRTSLDRELRTDDVFTPLSAQERRLEGPADYRLPPARKAPAVPPSQRWVPDIYANAADSMTIAYRDLGYLQAEVAPPQRRGTCPKGATLCHNDVVFSIHEGLQSFIASLGFAGNVLFSAHQLLRLVEDATAERALSAPIVPGAPLSQNGIEDARIAIIRRYREAGHLYARVFVAVDMNTQGRWGDVTFRVEEGPQVHVGRVLLRGNRYTRDGVVNSRITLRAGEVYHPEQAVADQRSIASLGVFSNARVKLIDEEHAGERKDVVVELTERNRQPIELSPGLSTAYGPRLRASYSHLNVLGTATTFTAALKVNRQIFFQFYGEYADLLQQRYANYRGWSQLTRALEREIRVGLRSPPIRPWPFDPVVRLDLVDQRVNAVRYSYNSEAALFGIDASLSRRLKASWEGQLGLINLECEQTIDPNCNQSPDLRRLQSVPIDVGQRWTLKGGPVLVWDLRDSPVNPTAGLFTSLRGALAIGSATPGHDVPFKPFTFSKYEANVTAYAPLWGAILALSLRGGYISLWRSQVPIDERFFMGGRDTLRGFVESTLMPQDACVGTGERPVGCAELVAPTPGYPPLSRGGNAYALLKTELRLPLRDNVSLDLFVDTGNLWVDPRAAKRFALRVGTGVGLRYATPVGALAIDLGFNPAPRTRLRERWWQLHFSIGSF